MRMFTIKVHYRTVMIKIGKPPALLGDTKSLTFAGIN
jgi:hypothetical protein